MQTLAADKKPGRAGRITLRDELAEVLGETPRGNRRIGAGSGAGLDSEFG